MLDNLNNIESNSNILCNNLILIEESSNLEGTLNLSGAKNSLLVILASLILTYGKTKLMNVHFYSDILLMIKLLKNLGAHIEQDYQNNILYVDTTGINNYSIAPDIMSKMRASILVMGPLLWRFGKVNLSVPGGCIIGSRPINYHLKAFSKMGAKITLIDKFINASIDKIKTGKFVLDYPSVGATENIIMASVLAEGQTEIINASLEPEVLELINILNKMGANIYVKAPANIIINGVTKLDPIEYTIMPDRIEAGTLILAAAITNGKLYLPEAPAYCMDVFLEKLNEMGHNIEVGKNGIGIKFQATLNPKAISVKTMPYPGFPTDLQAQMLCALSVADGISVVEETVFENRLAHVRELQKMGAKITIDTNKAIITGVTELYGANIIANDLRGCAALVIAGLRAKNSTIINGYEYLKRGYYKLEDKIKVIGGKISIV